MVRTAATAVILLHTRDDTARKDRPTGAAAAVSMTSIALQYCTYCDDTYDGKQQDNTHDTAHSVVALIEPTDARLRSNPCKSEALSFNLYFNLVEATFVEAT